MSTEPPLSMESMITWIMFLLLIAIIGYFSYRAILGLQRGKEAARKQVLSVYARYRNKMTEAFYDDMMSIPIAGLLPFEISVKDFLGDMFPRGMAELERQRTQNPEVWRKNIEFLAPVLIRLKALAVYGGQNILNKGMADVMQYVQGFLGQVQDQGIIQQDQSSSEDPNQRKA